MSGKPYASVVKGQNINKVNIRWLVPDAASIDKHMHVSHHSSNMVTGKENKHDLQCKVLDASVDKSL